jgi:SAM-dependent methyltransferase
MVPSGSFKALSRRLVLFWVRSGHRISLTRDLAPVIKNLEGTVLDVGGGRPAFHDSAWNGKARRIRLDLSARFQPSVVGNALALPFKPASIDAIVMCEVLEHLADPWQALAEAHRTLRPGGLLVGSVPFIMPVHPDPADLFRYTAEGLETLMHDFSTIMVIPHGNPIGGAWRLLTERSRLLVLLNPIFRLSSRQRSDSCPAGYVFVATK